MVENTKLLTHRARKVCTRPLFSEPVNILVRKIQYGRHHGVLLYILSSLRRVLCPGKSLSIVVRLQWRFQSDSCASDAACVQGRISSAPFVPWFAHIFSVRVWTIKNANIRRYPAGGWQETCPPLLDRGQQGGNSKGSRIWMDSSSSTAPSCMVIYPDNQCPQTPFPEACGPSLW